ncbi:hypothetical protein SAMN05428976_11355 [Clostridium sp. USBA 49]|uniref:hypothetical protein n=1 Tax=Clostridium sp. USBA 49 TaxID=1881060 RepID=UPI00099A02C3|nr:hypothetical protein [Clostridium sp. USBA 49]SKA89760.1 hypothetical protein SAMN05428976_11355 [Clostridium sp. USBA 49]
MKIQKPFDLQVEDFRNDLVNLINSTQQQLPLSVIVLIINDMVDNVNRQYNQYKNKLKEDYQNSLNEEISKSNKEENTEETK